MSTGLFCSKPPGFIEILGRRRNEENLAEETSVAPQTLMAGVVADEPGVGCAFHVDKVESFPDIARSSTGGRGINVLYDRDKQNM